MPLTYLERRRLQKPTLVRLLFAANLGLAAVVLLAWQLTLLWVLGPINWSSDSVVPGASDLLHLFEYPLFVYWAVPLGTTFGAWAMLQNQRHGAALGLLLLPLMLTAMTLAMYWIFSPAGG